MDVNGLTLNTFCTCSKPKMLREVRNFPSLTLGLISLQHLGHNTLHIEYAAVLRTQPRDSSNPMSTSKTASAYNAKMCECEGILCWGLQRICSQTQSREVTFQTPRSHPNRIRKIPKISRVNLTEHPPVLHVRI